MQSTREVGESAKGAGMTQQNCPLLGAKAESIRRLSWQTPGDSNGRSRSCFAAFLAAGGKACPLSAQYPSDSSSRRPHWNFLWGGLKMAFFECKVSRTVFTHDLKAKRATEHVYIEAKEGEW